jgi:hypothetical protein
MHASPVSLTPVVHSSQVYGTGTTPEFKKSSNIPKNLESFLGMSKKTRRKCFMKKTYVKRYHGTVSLSRVKTMQVKM